MPDYLMPRLSDTMEEGTVNAWLKADGDLVAVGDPLVEIETDKATMVCDAEVAGTLTIGLAEGETALVGAPIAWIGDGVREPTAATAGETTTSEAGPSYGGDSAASGAETSSSAAAGTEPTSVPSVPAAAAPLDPAAVNGAAVKASPIARRMARTLGIDLGAVAGTGPRGRVTRVDVERAQEAAAAPPVATPAAAIAPADAGAATTGRGIVTRIDLSRVQTIVARRMVEAKTEAPEFFLTVEVDMTEAVAVRKQLKALAGDGPAPSLNDFVVRASAAALARHPMANAAYIDGGIDQYSRVNVGIAVASEGSLLVPTVYDADQKSLGAVARETRRLALAGRDGTTTPADLSGGTFTVSNLGMFGIREFTAVLNAPQAGILAVGLMETRPVWQDDAFVPRSRMTMTLTCDHRVLYGADAAKFLADIQAGLEQPLSLAL